MGAGIYFGNNCGISVDDEQAQNDYQVIILFERSNLKCDSSKIMAMHTGKIVIKIWVEMDKLGDHLTTTHHSIILNSRRLNTSNHMKKS